MPRKIRELKQMLRKAGFRWRPGKGSHTIWEHPLAERSITLSGSDGHDAKPYQQSRVEQEVAIVRQRRDR